MALVYIPSGFATDLSGPFMGIATLVGILIVVLIYALVVPALNSVLAFAGAVVGPALIGRPIRVGEFWAGFALLFAAYVGWLLIFHPWRIVVQIPIQYADTAIGFLVSFLS